MVTRRGGNRVSLGGRFYLADGKLQASNEDFVAEIQEKEPDFLGINKIRENKDYGFNFGFPIIRDKAWFWGSWGVQDIKTNSVYQEPDDTLLQNLAAKLNLQIIPENRFEAFFHIGRKNKWGRNTSRARPEGDFQAGRWYLGSPVVKLQDEHMFGDNFFVSIKYGYANAGFNMTPMNDLDMKNVRWYNAAEGVYGDKNGEFGYRRYWVDRPSTQYNILGNYFNDTFFGASHDIKFGVEYNTRGAYTESLYPGNIRVNWNYNTNIMDFDGDGFSDPPNNEHFYNFRIYRGSVSDYGVKAVAAYFSDTVTVGRFNLLLGVRYDHQAPSINGWTVPTVEKDSIPWNSVTGPEAQDAMMNLLPPVTVPQKDVLDINGNKFAWREWSPRIGVTWDVMGDGKTIAKLALAKYGNYMGTGSYGQNPGGTGGIWQAYWWDNSPDTGRAPDGIIQLDELYWRTYGDGKYTPYQLYPTNNASDFRGDWADSKGSMWSGYEYDNPTQLVDPYNFRDANTGSSWTWEVLATLEKEIFADFAVQLNASYRRYDNFSWDLKVFRDADGNIIGVNNQDWWEPNNLPIDNISQYLSDDYTKWDGSLGEAPQHPWYTYKNEVTLDDGSTINPAYSSDYSWTQKRPDYYRDYYGVDLVFTKRLSNRWMLNGSFSLIQQSYHYGTEGFIDPTNIWAWDGQPASAYQGGSSGKISQYTFTPWMFKLGGLYQLPYAINISFNFSARDGHILEEGINITDYTLPNTRDRGAWLNTYTFGHHKLPTFYNLDLRLEKMWRSGDFGRIYFMADLFNALNSKHENRRYQREWGTFYWYGEGNSRNRFREDLDANTLNEILNPRIIRFGIRFQF